MQRKTSTGAGDDKSDVDAADGYNKVKSLDKEEPAQSPSNLVFGYLNLFSDGVVCVSYYVYLSFHILNYFMIDSDNSGLPFGQKI